MPTGIQSTLLAAALIPVVVFAKPDIECVLEYTGAKTVVSVQKESHALGGQWTELEDFRVRSLLSAPADRRTWLLVEVYSKTADGDTRMVSSHKLFKPFASGRVTVVEPQYGRSLEYECGTKR